MVSRSTSKKYTDAQRAEQLVRCWELRRAGHSQHEIARAVGLSQTTVYRRLREAFEAQVSPERDEVRAWEDSRLDWVVKTAVEVADSADDPEVRLKALDRVMKASERRSHMHGVDAPAKSLVVNSDVPYDPNTEFGRVFAEELSAARAEYRPEGDSDAVSTL